MRKAQLICSGFLFALVGSLATANASAHDFDSHNAITRAAVSALHYWLEDPSGNFCPKPTDPLPSATFKAQATTALANLKNLRTGLRPVDFDTTRCNYYPEDRLDKIGQFRISDFRYVVNGDYDTGCQMDALQGDRLDKEGWRTLGSVLGIMAGDVDNRADDTVMWIKPTNAFVWGAIKDGLSEVGTILGAVALAPFACLWSVFSSSGSCGDAKKWSIKYNPIDYAAGLIPGIPFSFTGSDIGFDVNGIWHFEQTATAGNLLTFANDPSGMYYPFAGPAQIPGALDLAIIVATSATGVSLNARSSLGVRDFGQFDEASRPWPLWEAHTFDKTEFTPVSKLAKYGKKEYDNSNHTTAAKLGYPLHAFEDASFPQHIACTTAWGHRPLEDAMNNARADILKYTTSDDKFSDCHLPVEIILQGYNAWNRYNLASGGHTDVEDMVEYLATSTRNWIDDHAGVWSDSASSQYLLTKYPHTNSVASYANTNYAGNDANNFMTLAEFSKPLELAAAGGVIAFLVDAGLSVGNVPVDLDTQCPGGRSYVKGAGCQQVPASILPTTNVAAVTSRTVASPTVCANDGMPCSTNADCCNNLCSSSSTCAVIIQ